MITAEMIRRLAPRARQDYVDALVNGGETFERWGIDTPLRMAAFLATICHETGGLTIVRENMNYTASRIRAVWPTRPEAVRFARNPKALANSVYGGRMGNERDGTDDDDGHRYRGGGLIQLTGRDSYERAGKALGVDLAENPDLIEDATISLQAACWEFSQHLKYCDMGERGWKAVCNGINRGNPLSKLNPIGWADRQIWYSRCCDALGITGKVEDDLLRVGDRGELVRALQERLKALGYVLGDSDGIFGHRTRAAVLAFQAENDLATDGIIGPNTRAALNAETAVPMPTSERVNDTLDDLKAKGSRTINSADKGVKTMATLGGGSAVFGLAQAADALTGASEMLKEINTLKTLTMAFTDVLGFFTAHWYLVLILVSYLGYRWFRDIQAARLEDHQTGVNLAR